MTDPQKNFLQWGNMGASGAAIALLVSSLSMLDQQGEDVAELRRSVTNEASGRVARATEVDLALVKLQHELEQFEGDLALLRTVATNPRARPDSWTRSDDARRMSEFRDEVRDLLEQERQRWVGTGGPLHLQQLLDIQRAIASLDTDDPDLWTKDGRPRVHAVSRRMGGAPVSESQVNRADALLKAAKSLKP